jgi:hypothetical protein
MGEGCHGTFQNKRYGTRITERFLRMGESLDEPLNCRNIYDVWCYGTGRKIGLKKIKMFFRVSRSW